MGGQVDTGDHVRDGEVITHGGKEGSEMTWNETEAVSHSSYTKSELAHFEVHFPKSYMNFQGQDAVRSFCNCNRSVPDSITAQHTFKNIYDLIEHKINSLNFNATQNGSWTLLKKSVYLLYYVFLIGFMLLYFSHVINKFQWRWKEKRLKRHQIIFSNRLCPDHLATNLKLEEFYSDMKTF